jgi:hypothetical protein
MVTHSILRDPYGDGAKEHFCQRWFLNGQEIRGLLRAFSFLDYT